MLGSFQTMRMRVPQKQRAMEMLCFGTIRSSVNKLNQGFASGKSILAIRCPFSVMGTTYKSGPHMNASVRSMKSLRSGYSIKTGRIKGIPVVEFSYARV